MVGYWCTSEKQIIDEDVMEMNMLSNNTYQIAKVQVQPKSQKGSTRKALTSSWSVSYLLQDNEQIDDWLHKKNEFQPILS